MRETFAITLLGASVGVALSLVAAHAMRALLFGVSPSDPRTIATAAGVLVVVATAASYLAARRAGRIDPVRALNGE